MGELQTSNVRVSAQREKGLRMLWFSALRKAKPKKIRMGQQVKQMLNGDWYSQAVSMERIYRRGISTFEKNFYFLIQFQLCLADCALILGCKEMKHTIMKMKATQILKLI